MGYHEKSPYSIAHTCSRKSLAVHMGCKVIDNNRSAVRSYFRSCSFSRLIYYKFEKIAKQQYQIDKAILLSQFSLKMNQNQIITEA